MNIYPDTTGAMPNEVFVVVPAQCDRCDGSGHLENPFSITTETCPKCNGERVLMKAVKVQPVMITEKGLRVTSE